MTKKLREQYFANEIFKIGDIVEDSETGAQLKIIDRGSNYITVIAEGGEVSKKWLNAVSIVAEKEKDTEPSSEFRITESGQIAMFGGETKNFDIDLSTFVLEQFTEFDDSYAKHQIIQLLDLALQESNEDTQYELLEKVSALYDKKDIWCPIVVEGLKNDVERKRIAAVIASVANIKVTGSPYNTVSTAIKVLKTKYKKKEQWEALLPIFRVARKAGLMSTTSNLPYDLDNSRLSEDSLDDIHESIETLISENVDEFIESLEIDDIQEAFETEFTETILSEEQLNEVLSPAIRSKLAAKMRQHEALLQVNRARALTRAATTSVLQDRARKLAETMLKRKMFKKDAKDMTRQEKERFEAGAARRKALVAKLTQKLIAKVRLLQVARMHAAHTAADQTGAA
jgi:hypothetical protein